MGHLQIDEVTEEDKKLPLKEETGRIHPVVNEYNGDQREAITCSNERDGFSIEGLDRLNSSMEMHTISDPSMPVYTGICLPNFYKKLSVFLCLFCLEIGYFILSSAKLAYAGRRSEKTASFLQVILLLAWLLMFLTLLQMVYTTTIWWVLSVNPLLRVLVFLVLLAYFSIEILTRLF